MSKVLIVDFHNINPHIETSFEIAKRHLDAGDSVAYHFLGHDLPYKEHLVLSVPERWLFQRWLPERRAARLVANERFTFVGRSRIDHARHRVDPPGTLDELKSWTYDGADLGMGVASSLISHSKNSRFDPAEVPHTVAAALTSSVAAYEHCKALFAEERPDVIYVFNGRWCLSRAALRAAERSGAKVLVHERGADMHRYVVRDYIPHDRARLQRDIENLWREKGGTEEAAAEGREWYEERRRGTPRDWPAFTALQARSHVPDLPEGKRIVTYFSSSDDELVAIGEAFRWQGWADQADAVRGLIEVAGRLPDVQLVIRLHPHLGRKHPEDRLRWLEVARTGGVALVIEPESPVDSYALIEASDVVVTGGSTIGMEAVHLGKPSILLGPSDYDLLGVVETAYTRERLEELLAAADLTVDPADALPYGFYRATFGERFRHYEATSLFTGRFMGIELHRLPHLPGALNKVKETVLAALRGKRRPPRGQVVGNAATR